eukprot:9563177-Prorocentrum_lima.AAC.1
MRAATVAVLPRLPCCPGDPVHHAPGLDPLAAAGARAASVIFAWFIGGAVNLSFILSLWFVSAALPTDFERLPGI